VLIHETVTLSYAASGRIWCRILSVGVCLSSAPVHIKRHIVFSRLSGEAVSAIGGRVAMAGLVKLLQGPHDEAVKYLAEHVVAPHLAAFEKAQDRLLPGVETDDERMERLKQTPADRAQHMAGRMVYFSGEFLAGFIIQIVGQDMLDGMFKIPHVGFVEQAKLGAVDRAVQIGSFVMLNPIAPGINKNAQQGISSMLQKVLHGVGVNIDEKRADKIASHVMNVRLPNALGSAAAGIGQYKFIQAQSAGK